MTVTDDKPLRFARLTRVSSEGQETEGESLNVQRRQIEAAIAQLGGIATARYDGQEHAMPNHERKKFESMLCDAARGIFDAICVADSSRWSRDNTASKRAIGIFRTHGIRFFCLTREFDLHDP